VNPLTPQQVVADGGSALTACDPTDPTYPSDRFDLLNFALVTPDVWRPFTSAADGFTMTGPWSQGDRRREALLTRSAF
jgi:hypothetical protein